VVEPPFTEFYEVLPKSFQTSLIWGMRLVAIVARVGASVDTTGHFSPLPLAKGADDGQDQSLGALAAAVGTLVAVGLLVLIMMVVVEARPAEAIFPGKNGKIAFVREGALDSHILTINPDGSGLAKISTRPLFDSSPAWPPDGKKIAFSKFVRRMRIGGQIFTMNATDGSQKRNLTNARFQESQPDWSPDGKRIAYTSPLSLFR
jgi:WD40-like Beta Propeller Repeat